MTSDITWILFDQDINIPIHSTFKKKHVNLKIPKVTQKTKGTTKLKVTNTILGKGETREFQFDMLVVFPETEGEKFCEHGGKCSQDNSSNC